MRSLRFTLPLVLLLAVLPACSNGDPQLPRACTLIGCQDGLNVTLAAQPDGAFRIEVLLPEGETLTFNCAQAGHCPSGAFFPGVAAEQVTVRLTTARGTRTETVRPRYEIQRPNGRDCPPQCRQARVTLQLPE